MSSLSRPVGDSDARFGSNLLPVDHRAASGASPVFNYPYARTRDALARLARTHQVIVVTHLPQVAAYADRHVVVRKSGDGSVTASDVITLDDDERVKELSRMLAGLEDSAMARGHAVELLAAAAATRSA